MDEPSLSSFALKDDLSKTIKMQQCQKKADFFFFFLSFFFFFFFFCLNVLGPNVPRKWTLDIAQGNMLHQLSLL
jgi:hypothetical protein